MNHWRKTASIFIMAASLLLSGCLHRVKPEKDTKKTGAMSQDTKYSSKHEKQPKGDADATAGIPPKILIEEARSQACTAAKQYMSGSYDDARINLDAALLNLQLADLPSDMQKVSFFQPYLPEDCSKVDLQKVYDNLQEMAKKQEFDIDETIPSVSDSGFENGDQQFIAAEIIRLMTALGEDPVKPEELDVFVQEVEGFINYLITDKQDWFEGSYYRMLKYKPTVEQIFSEKKLPLELRYLAFVESGYNFNATSRAKARGIWQFIASTAQVYELKVSRGIDERIDPVKATIAAREYFLDLIAIFGSKSFLLAMASYNAGEGKVQKCLRQLDDPFEDRSFWQIRDCLRQETRDYIPLIIAAAILCENPKRFGLNLLTYEELIQDRELVICPTRIRLQKVAQIADVDLQVVKDLNPDLPTGCIWTPVNNVHLWLPKNCAENVKTALASIEDSETIPPEDPIAPKKASSKTASIYHTVKKGETLCKIGRQYNMDYKILAKMNNLKYPYALSLNQKILISKGSTENESESESGTSQSTICSNTLTYIVQKGNYLAGIASLFGLTARDIMRSNELVRGSIQPGQKLTICPAYPVEIIQHNVGSKETLYQISKKYNVTVDDILFANGINQTDSVQSGSQLIIYKRKSS